MLSLLRCRSRRLSVVVADNEIRLAGLDVARAGVDTKTVAILRTWRKTQFEERMRVNLRPKDTELVCAHRDGTFVNPDYLSQIFDRRLAKSSLPRIRLHDLRHTHATLLLQKGIALKVVSEPLGHAQPAFTLSVYQHVLPGMQADGAQAFSEAVFG